MQMKEINVTNFVANEMLNIFFQKNNIFPENCKKPFLRGTTIFLVKKRLTAKINNIMHRNCEKPVLGAQFTGPIFAKITGFTLACLQLL